MRDPKVVWAKFARYPFWPALTVDPDSLTVDEVTKLKSKKFCFKKKKKMLC